MMEPNEQAGLTNRASFPDAPRAEVPDTATATPADIAGTETWKPGAARPISGPIQTPAIAGYEVQRFLGRGGMGFVVQARDVKLGRLVALKLPLPEKLRSEEDRERFLREARASARLRHPNICPIYEIGEVPPEGDRPGQPYIAMGFIEGASLSQWAKDQKPTAREAAEVVGTLALAIGYAHEHGVVHRDIKPANVMIDRESGQPILMDFGLAKDLADEDTQLTHAGTILGTPAYMAPEQAAGNQAKIGPRTDVYALGALLYWLLCHQAPFEGSFGEILKLVQTSEPTSPRKLHRGLHRDLETICLKAMAKDPASRYETATALAEDLKRFAAGEAILARPDGLVKKSLRFVRRRPLAVGGGIIAVGILVAAGVLVQRATHEQAVTEATQLVNNQLQSGDWTQQRFTEVQKQIEDLRAISPENAESAQEQLRLRYRDFVRGLIARPSLPPDAVERIEKEIGFVESIDAEIAQDLQQELIKALRTWGAVFDLAPPYTDVAQVFDSKYVRAENRALVTNRGNAPLVPTLVTSEGNVELRATFPEAALLRSSRLGLALNLNMNSQESYEFVLALPTAKAVSSDSPMPKTAPPAEAAPPPAATLGEALVAGTTAELQIVRNGIVMRKIETRVPAPPLRFAARREGGRLTLQLNEGSPLIFDDVFPLGLNGSGVFGLVAAADVAIEHVSAARQALPATPSPLERGDLLFAQGKYSEALENYRAQEAGAANDVAQESRCKQGICLVQLQRKDEAVKLLANLSAEAGDRWPIVAACHLWLFLVREKRFEEAEPIAESLASRYQFEQLATLLPAPLRSALLREYRTATVGQSLITFDAEKLHRLERNLEVERLIDGQESFATQVALLRGYRALALRQKATHLAGKIIQGPDFLSHQLVDRIWLVEEYCWELRLQGRRQEALAAVNGHLMTEQGEQREEYLPLLIERARCQIALGRWKEAEADIDEFLAKVPAGKMLYRHFSAAHLVQGFCREERGDAAGALEAWKAGLYRVWQPEAARLIEPGQMPIPELPAENHNQFSGMEMVQFSMLCALTQEISDAEANRLFFWITSRSGGGDDLATVQSLIGLLQKDFAVSIFRRLAQNPRGRSVARGIGLQTVGLSETYQQPLFLCVYEVAHQGAFQPELTSEQDEYLWKFAGEAYQAFLDGKVNKTHFIFLALTWKGTAGPLGWEGVAPQLEPGIRGQLAYLMGHRFERLGKPAEAIKFFRTAAQDSAADSPLRKLADAELKRRDAQKAP